MESIVVALITGGLALVGVIITNISNSKRMESQLATAQAVTDTKLDNLTEEVTRHNKLVDTMPVLETRVAGLETRVTKLEDHIL